MDKADAYGHLDAMYRAIRALAMLDTASGSVNKDEGLLVIEHSPETKAHQEILVSLRALGSIVGHSELGAFETNYVKCLSSVYHDPEEALSEANGWCLFSAKAAAEVRPMLIRNVTQLYAALSDRLNPGVVRHRVLSAPPETGACLVVSDLCADVFAWLQRQSSVGEESLTDWLLYKLSDHLAWVRYVKFTRHEESWSSGADWEWWFLGDGECLGMRIQAKKTRGHPDVYPLLAYSNRRGLQIERLLEGARQGNLLPLYAFYDAPTPMPSVPCPATSHTRSCGVFIASGRHVYDEYIARGRQPVNADSLLATSNPLTCLFCCAQSIDSAGPSYYNKVTAYVDRICTGSVRQDDDTAHIGRTGVHEEPPAYVRALMEAPAQADVGWIQGEFGRSLQEVNAIVAFDLRAGLQQR